MAKWVYTWKTDEFGRVVRVKARLVARGFAQRDGVDFFETFSPCPSVTSIRLLAALACELGLDLCHFDAERAFVRSELNDQHLVRDMNCFEFEQYAADAYVMRLVEKGAIATVVVVHVDDIFSVGLKSRCEKFGRGLNENVPISNFEKLPLYAGIRFSHDLALGTVTLSQKAFVENLVAKFGVNRNKETPIAVGVKLENFDAHEPDVHKPFRSLVGHLMWLANQTRPDTLNAVQAIARYSHAPKFAHSSGNRGTDNEALVG